MAKRKNDQVRNFGKTTEKEANFGSYFGCFSTFNKAKNSDKTKKTSSSSMPRTVKYKTVKENCIEKSLAPFDA